MKKNASLLVLISLISLMVLVQGCKKATVPEVTTVAYRKLPLPRQYQVAQLLQTVGKRFFKRVYAGVPQQVRQLPHQLRMTGTDQQLLQVIW